MSPAVRRTTRRVLPALAVLLLALGLVVGWSAPARAAGSPSYRTITNEWASGAFTMVRDGWSVNVSVRLTDRKAGHCVYARVELIVDPGNNPGPVRFGNSAGGESRNNCNGNGSSTTDKVRLTPVWGEGYTQVRLWVCEDNAFSDDCTSAYAPVNQNNAQRSDLVDEMSTYMTESMSAFLRHKAAHPGPFDWSDNGCSSPVGDAPSGFNFRNACLRHDFGYRNYGHGLTVNPTDARRDYVDNRFRSDMVNWCNANTTGSRNTDCREWATIYFAAVRTRGGPSFF